MRFRAGNILGGELAVEIDRRVDLLHDLCGSDGEAAAPHLVAHRPLGQLKMRAEKAGFGRKAPVIAVAAIAVAAAGLAVLYGKGTSGKDEATLCPNAGTVAERLAPLAHGEVAALNVDKRPKPATDIAFNGPDGK